MKVQTAFLNADVGEEDLVKISAGYERSNQVGVFLVVKLKKYIGRRRHSPEN